MDTNRLRTIDAFATMDADQLHALAEFATGCSVPAGTVLVSRGEYAYELMAIEQGEADVRCDGQCVGVLYPGECFGEIGVLDRALRTATVVASTPMRLIGFSRWSLRRAGLQTTAQVRAALERRELLRAP